jgi:UPF0755 protein
MRRVLVALVILLAALAAVAGVLYSRVDAPFRGYTSEEQFIDIPPGSAPGVIGHRLVDAGVVRDRLTWRIALFESGSARELKAGEYRFDVPLSPRQVIARLVKGDVYLRPITFPEGLTIAEMAQIFQSHEFGSSADFIHAASDVSLVKTMDPDARDLEGYLFPDTYGLPRHATAGQLVAQMVGRFNRVFGDDLKAASTAHGFKVREAVTLASIVEKETARPEERPEVAAVYLNRLRIGMGLQCDPTVIYALQKAGRYTGNLTRENMQFDSPYNTYRYAGLPPGPIAAPGRASLQAALNPAPVDYLYFVSRNDGTHVFARTYDEQRKNVQDFQIAPTHKNH